MAWVERFELAGGARFRVAERGPDGRTVKGELLRSERDAQRLAGRIGLEKQRGELSLIRKDYPIQDFLTELPGRLKGTVSDRYIELWDTLIKTFGAFLEKHAPSVRTLSEITRPVLLEYRRVRVDAKDQRSGAPYAGTATELTVAQASKLMGYRKASVTKLIWKGHLVSRVAKSERFDYHLITRASIDAFMATPRYERGKRQADARSDAASKAGEHKKPKNLRKRTINRELTMLWIRSLERPSSGAEVKGVSPPAPSVGALPDVLDVKQAMHVLGVGKSTLYEWVAKGDVPCLRYGRIIKFDKAALLVWRGSHATGPAPAGAGLNWRRRARSATRRSQHAHGGSHAHHE